MRTEFQQEVATGFEIVCDWISKSFDLLVFIVFLPISYPLSLLGKRERARLRKEDERVRRENEDALAEYKKARETLRRAMQQPEYQI